MKSLLIKIVPSFIFSWYHFGLAFLGALIYSFPSKKLIIIGITGTNGKSSVVHLVTEILEQAGFKTASLSSIRFKIGKKEFYEIYRQSVTDEQFSINDIRIINNMVIKESKNLITYGTATVIPDIQSINLAVPTAE